MAIGLMTVGATMTFVVDASVAVKFLTSEAGSAQAFAYIDSPEALIAPDLIVPEVANALWKKVKQSELLEIHAQRSIDDLPEFFVSLESTVALMRDAFRLSFQLRHAVYDCVYLALAIRESAILVTADRKFMNAIGRQKLQRFAELLTWSDTIE
jgi:predicted nucleic acid-binding protein